MAVENPPVSKRQLIYVVYHDKEIIRQYSTGTKGEMSKEIHTILRFIRNRSRIDHLKEAYVDGRVTYLDMTVLEAMGHEIKHVFGEDGEEMDVWKDMMMTSRYSNNFGASILYSIPFRGSRRIYLRDWKEADNPENCDIKHTINLDNETYKIETYDTDTSILLRFDYIRDISPKSLADKLKMIYMKPDKDEESISIEEEF